MPEYFNKLSSLGQIDKRASQLDTLPESFGNLPALTNLTLYENGLKSIPGSFVNLKALKHLKVQESSWLEVSPDIKAFIRHYYEYEHQILIKGL